MDKVSLYKRHKIVYNDPVSGKFNKIRLTSMTFIALIFFILPWIKYNEKHAFLFDLSCTRLYFFGSIIWPQDFILVAIFCVIAVVILFLVTLYAGRVWCGFLCPQSIWIKIAVFFSRLTEGNRNKRKKIDESKLNLNIFKKKTVKHILWLVFSFFTAFTFVGYFIPIENIFFNIINFNIISWKFFWIIFFSFLTYFNIGWFREQFCFIVCPYSRLQSVMFDENTWIVAYDKDRGEKRGARNKNLLDYKKNGLGDCIDCYKCVNCCPTGIDIRDGLQMECIGCAACIDACDSVMEKMNYPKGLIGYMKEGSLIGKKNNISVFRIFAYLSVLFFLISLLSFGIITRPLTQLNVNRSQGQLYNITNNNDIENFYFLKVTNKTLSKRLYKVSILNHNFEYIGIKNFVLKGEETISFDAKLKLTSNSTITRFSDIIFKIECLNSNKNDFVIKKSKFIIPK